MADTVIKVENLSKQYRLGQINTGALAHDINRWWYRLRGKEDPYVKIGETNDRTQIGKSDYVWALKDISFEVKQGEVLGIIGRNGAGKSTLLKILSRTTAPTTGSVKIKGRVASLLEVGTGFHPELSGRENIFLNGAILGMRKKEIVRKFDEIVDFAGVERYIDTPVKRYSSGMYVRLAFAVAAHLEPEILIVDEVLAVGDAEFQKKCLGKMKDVSEKDGRTVLFVSHNMGAIQKLCNVSALINAGTLIESGETQKIINRYLNDSNLSSSEFYFNQGGSNKEIYVTKMAIEDFDGKLLTEIPIGKPWRIKVFFNVNEPIENIIIGIGIVDNIETPIRTSWNSPSKYEVGSYVAVFEESNIIFATGKYKILIGISRGLESIEYIDREDMWVSVSDIVHHKDETVVRSDNGIILNQMNMYVKKLD